MVLNGYIINSTSNEKVNKIIERIKYMGIDFYKIKKYYPVYLIQYKDNQRVYIESAEEIDNYMNILGYSFEGLVDDIDKVTEIEEFGKYACIINRVCNEEYNGLTKDLFN